MVLWYCVTAVVHVALVHIMVHALPEAARCWYTQSCSTQSYSTTVPQYHSTQYSSPQSHSTTVPQYHSTQYSTGIHVLHVHTCQYCIHVTHIHTTCYIIQHVCMYDTCHTHARTRARAREATMTYCTVYCGTVVLWYCVTVWYCVLCTVVLWYCGTV